MPSLFLLAGLGLNAGTVRADTDAQRDFNAVQRVYQKGVPQIDRRGKPLASYDPAKSFFPIGLVNQPYYTERYGYHYQDWKALREDGFNNVWPWHTGDREQALQMAADGGVQVVLMQPMSDADLKKLKDHPNLLGNMWMDEPTGRFGAGMEQLFNDFTTYKAHATTIAPNLPVFVNDTAWIMEPATSWWMKWNTTGDFSVHDNYQVKAPPASTHSIGALPNGIPQTVALAVAANKEQKPVWCLVGAFESQPTCNPHDTFPFRFPTPMQLRASVYAALVHGATGIIYFTQDSVISRDGGIVGMSPNPQVVYAPNPQVAGTSKPSPATPVQLATSRALWTMATQINREIQSMTPALLSPTVGYDCDYSVHVTGQGITSTPIRTLLKRHPDGSLWLLTVNVDDAVLDATYTFPNALKSVALQFENKDSETLKPDATTFAAHYEAYETHVYRIQ